MTALVLVGKCACISCVLRAQLFPPPFCFPAPYRHSQAPPLQHLPFTRSRLSLPLPTSSLSSPPPFVLLLSVPHLFVLSVLSRPLLPLSFQSEPLLCLEEPQGPLICTVSFKLASAIYARMWSWPSRSGRWLLLLPSKPGCDSRAWMDRCLFVSQVVTL